jgi:hypothetical protein
MHIRTGNELISIANKDLKIAVDGMGVWVLLAVSPDQSMQELYAGHHDDCRTRLDRICEAMATGAQVYDCRKIR